MEGESKNLEGVKQWSKRKTWTVIIGFLLVWIIFPNGSKNEKEIEKAPVQVKGAVEDQVAKRVKSEVAEKEPQPVVEIREEIKKEEVGYETIRRNDYSILKGETEIEQRGENGIKETKYQVTYADGKKTKRKLVSEEITTEPIEEIVLVGTKVKAEVARVVEPSGYTCNCSKACSKMSSCAEAQFQLNTCGCTRRDGDHDGIACDRDCQ